MSLAGCVLEWLSAVAATGRTDKSGGTFQASAFACADFLCVSRWGHMALLSSFTLNLTGEDSQGQRSILCGVSFFFVLSPLGLESLTREEFTLHNFKYGDRPKVIWYVALSVYGSFLYLKNFVFDLYLVQIKIHFHFFLV
jgi:hypothetical protein